MRQVSDTSFMLPILLIVFLFLQLPISANAKETCAEGLTEMLNSDSPKLKELAGKLTRYNEFNNMTKGSHIAFNSEGAGKGRLIIQYYSTANTPKSSAEELNDPAFKPGDSEFSEGSVKFCDKNGTLSIVSDKLTADLDLQNSNCFQLKSFLLSVAATKEKTTYCPGGIPEHIAHAREQSLRALASSESSKNGNSTQFGVTK